MKVFGNGYTNHCPKCLWSKHVDVYPGDREEKCQGQMKPIGVFKAKGKLVITHECIICGCKKNNKTSTEDDTPKLVKISHGSALTN